MEPKPIDPNELHIPEEAIITSPSSRWWILGSGVLIATLVLGGGAYLAARHFLPTPTPVTETDLSPETVHAPGTEAYDAARENLPVQSSNRNLLQSSTSDATVTPVAISRTNPADVHLTFTPIDPAIASGTAAITSEPPRSEIAEPALSKAAEGVTTITTSDDSVRVVAPVVVTNTTAVGTPAAKTFSGLIRDIDPAKSTVLVGYAGEQAMLVTVDATTEYILDGVATTFGALRKNDIVSVAGTGYPNSVLVTADRIEITGVFERDTNVQGN